MYEFSIIDKFKESYRAIKKFIFSGLRYVKKQNWVHWGVCIKIDKFKVQSEGLNKNSWNIGFFDKTFSNI